MSNRPRRIEGFAIISAEGMIADADRSFPKAIESRADYNFFHDNLRRMQACVHGRHSHEGGPDAAERARLILTRSILALAPDPKHTRSMLWNPAGAPFEDAWRALGVEGDLAVVGGTDVFGLFLEIGYDAFHLTRSPGHVPGGRPVFPEVPGRTPEDVLVSFGLKPGPAKVLDPATGVAVVAWTP